MSPADFRPHHGRFDPDDWRFRSLLLCSALLIGSLTWWAVHEEVVEYVVQPIPERILKIIIDPEPKEEKAPPEPEPRPRPGPSAQGSGGGVVTDLPQPVWSPDAGTQTPFSQLFAHPVFGRDNPEMDRWDDALAELDPTVPERPLSDLPMLLAAPSGEYRTDAELPDPIELGGGGHQAVLVAVRERGPLQSTLRATMVPKLEPDPHPDLKSTEVARATRSWRRHADACRKQTAAGWQGRVELLVTVEAGRVGEVKVQGSPKVPDAMQTCLQTRARTLLRFPADQRGKAKLPFVFQ